MLNDLGVCVSVALSIIKKDVYILTKKGTEFIDIKEERNINYDNLCNEETIGSIKILVDDVVIDEVDLYVLEDIKKANIFSIILEVLKEMFFVT